MHLNGVTLQLNLAYIVLKKNPDFIHVRVLNLIFTYKSICLFNTFHTNFP